MNKTNDYGVSGQQLGKADDSGESNCLVHEGHKEKFFRGVGAPGRGF
ncbi:hypothetical protein LC608_24810 [Nostoc sp. XA010]|nr:hypothetical protein [Nostoc sp. XA010]MCC5660139.1 hypothetical protein [Nostoc sp. XA010]